MASSASLVLGIESSLSGRAWRWRGGNMDLAGGGALEVDLVDQLLLARGVEAGDLGRHRAPSLREFLPDPAIFRDMEAAAERLAQAVLTRETVTVYGDYDVDGATSAALLIRLLRQLGHDARHYIPDRLLEGYGPSGEALERIGKEGSSLIVTVDCGAMAHEALALAHAAGIDVIVVDHHKCAAELPLAAALVNPNRLDECEEAAAHGHLAAVGVAFLLAVATVRRLRQSGYFDERAEPDLFGLLDLVALGTVADVASLKGLNRAFVAQGLKVMARRENVGMAALIDASRLTRAPTCSDLGFALGPRVNAGGRVGESTLGVRLLTSDDPDEARAIAAQLCAFNDERRGSRDGSGSDRRCRPDRGTCRLARYPPWGRCPGCARERSAVARSCGGAGRALSRSGRSRRAGRSVRHGLAGPAGGGRPGQTGEGRHRRERPRPPDRQRARRRAVQGDRLPRRRKHARPDLAERRARPRAMARRPAQAR
jgi:single-stranded-DNA-specific exonuclease